MGIYTIVQLDIFDRDSYDKYATGFMDIFPKYNFKILAVDEKPKIIEGEWPYTMTVITWVESYEELMRMYNSEEYQEVAQHRYKGVRTNWVMLQALE